MSLQPALATQLAHQSDTVLTALQAWGAVFTTVDGISDDPDVSPIHFILVDAFGHGLTSFYYASQFRCPPDGSDAVCFQLPTRSA
jgi:hypothetical protein